MSLFRNTVSNYENVAGLSLFVCGGSGLFVCGGSEWSEFVCGGSEFVGLQLSMCGSVAEYVWV